ncbi:helix-turn-helix domain-containing protein [Roseibium porphyridii]|uniref:Helix-turn-helix domain-containing protein n=2 Tax=Stappiaceae TaxID=2821832 RepID=A0ABY8F774_9HYPH|nr:AraC family transcriptional regulator [Roseibium sp. KMA01]WFE91086.1 helix-turn-helix domain-containing protein [Roseibium sp. KMA01]
MTTVSNGTVMTVVASALSRALTISEVQDAAGISCNILMNPIARPPEDVTPRIMLLLGERFPNEPITLDIARAAPFSFFGGLAEGARFADDLRTAIKLLTKNCSVISDQLELAFQENSSEAKIVSSHPMNHIDNGRSAEIGSASIARLFSEFLGLSDCFKRITFSHEPNCDVQHYVDYFGVPVDFNASEISLILKPEKLDEPIKQANVELFNYVQTHLSGVKKQIEAAKEPKELKALRNAAAENARAGLFSAVSVAAAANMSVRTAQRIAAENGTTVQGLIDKIREHRAMELLRDNRNDIGSIAFLLGYSDERAFRRAFQRWTGQTPSDFRKQLNKAIE